MHVKTRNSDLLATMEVSTDDILSPSSESRTRVYPDQDGSVRNVRRRRNTRSSNTRILSTLPMTLLDLVAIPTVLISHIYSFLSLSDHIRLSRTTSRLNVISRIPTSSPERVVLNHLLAELYRFHPRGLAIVGDDGNVPLDITLLSERFPALRFLSLSNETELRDLSKLKRLETLCCRRVHQPVPLPLSDKLTSIHYDYYTTEDTIQLFCEPNSRQLRSFRLQWMRDSTPQVFPTRLPNNVCDAIVHGGSSLTDLVLSIDLTQSQLTTIARAMCKRITTLGMKRICDDPPSLAKFDCDDDPAVIVGGSGNGGCGDGDGGGGGGKSYLYEFAALTTLSVSGWHAAVVVSGRAPALRSLTVNSDTTELGQHSWNIEMQFRQSYWSANIGVDECEEVSPRADKRLYHATLTSLIMCAPHTFDVKWMRLQFATRLPSLRILSTTKYFGSRFLSSPPLLTPTPFRLDDSIESFELNVEADRATPVLPSSSTLTSLVLRLYPALDIKDGFAIPYPSLMHITLSGPDPTRVLLLLDGFVQLQTIRLEWIALNLRKIPDRVAPILRRLLPTLPNLRQLHLGPHVRANLSELRRAAARLQKVITNHPCIVSCDSDLRLV
jgi:hypothetical protein